MQRRALLIQMTRRDFEQRYVGSMAGWLWGLIHPLMLLLSWTFVFAICMKVEAPKGALTQSYVLYLLAGYLPWALFQETVLRSANSLVENANLITKTVFPSEILPISMFFSSLIHHAFTLALLVIAIGLTEQHFSLKLAILPAYTFLIGLFAVGLGWVAAGLQVYIRDAAQVASLLLNHLWFWLTPVMIHEEYYPPEFRFLLDYNPMAYVVRAYRTRLLSSNWPDPGEFAVIAGCSVATFVLGGLFFRQLKRGFADVL